jgi:hypothetical protein
LLNIPKKFSLNNQLITFACGCGYKISEKMPRTEPITRTAILIIYDEDYINIRNGPVAHWQSFFSNADKNFL